MLSVSVLMSLAPLALGADLLSLDLNSTYGSFAYFTAYGVLHLLKLGVDRRYVKVGAMFVRRHVLIACAAIIGWWLSAVAYTFLGERVFDARHLLSQLGIVSAMNISLMVVPSSRLFATMLKLTSHEMLLLHLCFAAMFCLTLLAKLTLTLSFYGVDYFEQLERRMMGGVATGGFTWLMGMSATLRRTFYELFFVSHRVFFVLLVAASVIHSPVSGLYLIPAMLSLVADLFFRICKTHKCKAARIEVVKDKDGVEYALLDVFMKANLAVYPNCYFLVNFKNISPYEWHPLSLVRAEDNRCFFCVKNNGVRSWSGLLTTYRNYERDKWRNRFEKEVYIQGPYGFSVIDYLSDKYTGILFVCGGISIMPLFSVLRDIHAKVQSRHLRLLEEVEVVWITRNNTLVDMFKDNMPQCDFLNLRCFTTGINDDDSESQSGRPDVRAITRRFALRHLKSECAAYVAGKYELVCDMQNVCAEVGIELNCESII